MERTAKNSNDQASASSGGAGAPPEPSAPNRAPADLTREYRGEDISVRWYASRCIHSAACIRALPRVFDPRRRPWIALEAADADAIARAVEACPTGALHFDRLDDGPPEQVPETLEIRTVKDGPCYVRGTITIVAEDGHLIRQDSRVALCRCGQSKHMPFCDNSHRAAGFRA